MLNVLTLHVDEARETVERDGSICLTAGVTDDWLSTASAEVKHFVDAHGPGDHDMVDLDQWDCPTIRAFATSPQTESFLESFIPPHLIEADHGYVTRALRILDGTGGIHSKPNVWHYDSNAVTMVVPIVIPDDGTGQLVLFPNSRPHRPTATLSALERVMVKNRRYNEWSRRRFRDDLSAHSRALVPGDVVIFDGHRSLHGTLPWPIGTLRATLVLQYGNPYGADPVLLRLARDARERWRQLRGHSKLRPVVAAES